MKINDQLPSFNTRTTTSQNFSDDFMKLLDDQNRSTQGNDYFRQHQDQLQQSQLTFDPLRAPQVTSITPQANSNTGVEKPEKQELKEHIIFIKQTPVTNEPTQTLSQMPVLNAYVNQTIVNSKLTSTLVDRPNIDRIELPEDTAKDINPLESPSLTTPVLKKHHLFVEHQQAELCVNACDLKLKEQKQLIQLIKNYLKNKGWSLKKLMINGVAHD